MAISVGEIRTILKNTAPRDIPEAIREFSGDGRKTVRNMLEGAQKRYEAYLGELERLEGLLVYEKELQKAGFKYIAGIDEVGRGPLAGPVVTAAVILKPETRILGINDSKKLSEKKREELYDIIKAEALAVSVSMEDHNVIDEINILNATLRAMKNAIDGLEIQPDFVLADAVTIPGLSMEQKGIIKGDSKSMSIAAASIIAKVTRDRLMQEYDKVWSGYGFYKNKGYGTAEHTEAIKRLGLCPMHMKSFTKGLL